MHVVALCVLALSVSVTVVVTSGIEVVAKQEFTNDTSTQWISASVFGGVYSFLSQQVLWFGAARSNNLSFSGVELPGSLQPDLAVLLGLGYDPNSGELTIDLYAYSSSSNSVNYLVYYLGRQQWEVQDQVSVPYADYQYLIPDSNNLDDMTTLFLVSLNEIVLINLGSFTVAAEMDLSQQFVSQYPVSLVAGVEYYSGNLFIARTASLEGSTFAQIVDVTVQNDGGSSEGLLFSHVVYLDAACDNMFGWGNFLFWPQLHESNGTLYGWGLGQGDLLFSSVELGQGHIWGKAVGANSITNQALVVSGQPDGGGYMAWAAIHDEVRVKFVDKLFVPNDRLPQLGVEVVDPNCLSVLVAGHTDTGYGQITWLRYGC